MSPERPRERRPPIEVELWSSPPIRAWQEVGPVAVRLRAAGDLNPDLERRLDRRLARSANLLGADAVLQVVRRAEPGSAGSARAFEAFGLAVRWTEPPPPPSRSGTATVSVTQERSFEAPPLSSYLAPGMTQSVTARAEARRSESARVVAERATAVSARAAAVLQPARTRAAAALSGALGSRAKQLAISPEARERLERWAGQAKGEIAKRPAREATPLKLPSGCVLIILGLAAIWLFNMLGGCFKLIATMGR